VDAGEPGSVCDDRLAVAGLHGEELQAALIGCHQAAKGEAPDRAGHQDIRIDGLLKPLGRELFEPQLVSGAIVSLRFADQEPDGAGERCRRMKREWGGEGLRAIDREDCRNRNRGIGFLSKKLLWIDIECPGEPLDPQDSELPGAGFKPADGDCGSRWHTTGGDVSEGEAPGLADFAQTTDHIGIFP